jgi:hypothetical protein
MEQNARSKMQHYLGKLFRIPRMAWYELLEPLKPVVYCRFVQSCNKTVQL